ncbi:MAG: DUF6279 family lipoprotein [Thiohalocapsa sp.]
MTRNYLLLPIVAVAVLLTACSSMKIAYNTADFFIERYADDYLGLDGAQMERWSPTLDAALARHREQELPYLAAFFDSAQNDARKGFTRTDVNCLLDQFEVIYRRHFTLAAEAAAPLLAGLDKTQIDTLERDFAKEAEEDAEDQAPRNAAKIKRKRAERYEDNMRWWIGDLSDPQRAIVRDVTASMPSPRDWYAYRDAKRRGLVALLRGGASSQRIARFLTDWVVEYRDMPATLTGAKAELRSGFTDLLVRLDATLDAGQRRKLIDRLTRLRGDFMSLQPRARMAPVRC